ncbi:Bug family tripartite tricarboxylate transporter substrate binding protein [Variovorax saccharolyticus]|uniref:Bug family tripartite tricarboxylate transporter substrate binding protein n=1 Tax=Variovorax saccharolyticus TaxID=3053516 RepID=UPI002577D793|nr:tripartite tricarboxylate transporter substrate binding protein [Variovorax sp. J31P216]MDM0028374.1 tripartite tricarboxylate transporter substrate binding protein [Variovorax sp. J31P216]
MNRRIFTRTSCALALAALAPLASAQGWPEKPIRLILSQPAGSGADAMARLIGDQLSKKLGQPIIVENRPGGQNAIGAQAAAKAPPDGYTFYFATAAALVMNQYLFKALPYDPRKDFIPVGMVGRVPFAVSVNPTSQFKSMHDLVSFARANPGKLDVANEGPKTFSGMMVGLLSSQLGVKVNSVPYASVSAGVTDTVGGQIEVIVSDVPSISQMVKAGKLRPLAVTTAKRISGWESVPTIAETLPGFDYAGWIGIVAPAGTPPAVVQRFNREMEVVLSDKEMAARLLAIGPMTEGAGTVAQMGTFLDGEHQRWAKLTKELGILPE